MNKYYLISGIRNTFLFLCLLSVSLVVGCTYSLNVVHTQGTASDTVDETQSNQPDVSPTLSIPAAVL